MTTPRGEAGGTGEAGASRWTVAIFALVGLGIGLLVFALRTPSYQAEALVAISNPAGPLVEEIPVVTGSTVINAATTTLGFQPDISVTAAEVASLLTITATADTAQNAANAANTVAATYVQAQLGAAANVAQQAEVPAKASGLGAPIFAAIGTLLGAIVGGIISFFQRLGRKPEAPELEPTVPDSALLPPDRSGIFTDSASVETQPIARPAPSTPAPVTPAAASAVPPVVEPTPAPTSFAAAAAGGDDAGQLIDHMAWADSSPAVPIGDDAVEPVAVVQPVDAAQRTELAEAVVPVEAVIPADAEPSDPTTFEGLAALEELDRRALLSQFETARYELVLTHNAESARKDADHERQVADLRGEVANLNKRVRMQEVRLKNRSGTDQTRVGDLEAQTDALEVELAGLRQTLETERITHTKRITEERGVADRALDNARRQYREELAKHVHTHRQALADHRAELDNELAEDRAKHAAALEEQHAEYERQLDNERSRLESQLAASTERTQRDLQRMQESNRQELERQAAQHKETIEGLRDTTENSDEQLRGLEKENRMLRVEVTSQQKAARQAETENASLMQRLGDEISIMRGELDAERERNAALRADVLRRSAEAHQAIDRAVEERTAQLSELEASVARQRDYADRRVREVSAASEEQARQAAMREADLTASISRLKRELAEAKNANDVD